MDRLRTDGADGQYGGKFQPYRGRRFLSYADLEERYGKSRVTIWRWVRAGLLPAPYETRDFYPSGPTIQGKLP